MKSFLILRAFVLSGQAAVAYLSTLAVRSVNAAAEPWKSRRRIQPSLLGVAVVAIGLAGSTSGSVAAASPSVADFQHTSWVARDGVLPDTWAIAQTMDGWLWFGGPNGLTRFDGLRFEKFDVESTDHKLSNGVRALFATLSGSLLIAHQSGGISILKDGRFARFDSDDILRVGGLATFAEGANGVIWGTARNGLMRFDGTRWAVVGSEWNVPSGRTDAALMDTQGTLNVSTPTEILRLPAGARRFERLDAPCRPSGEFFQSPDGRPWCLGEDGVHLLHAQADAAPRDLSITSRMSYAALFDKTGNLWTTLLFESGMTRPEFAVDIGSLPFVKTILEDREGNIWFGAQDATVHRLRRHAIDKLPNSPFFDNGVAPWISLAVDKAGAVWMATSADGRLSHAVDGAWKIDRDVAHRVQADAIKSATAIARDADGRVWIGGRQGIWRLAGASFENAIDLPEDARGTYLSGLTLSCSGGLWASLDGHGLFRYDGKTWQRNGSVPGLPDVQPSAQGCDSNGQLWLGYGDGSARRVDKGGATPFSAAQRLQVGAISAIHSGRHTLVAGERGLALLVDGKFQQLRAGTLPFESVIGIIESRNGDVWLNGGRGLIRIEAGEIDRAVASRTFDVTVELFDENDGFPMPPFAAAVGVQTMPLIEAGDGRIWFAGNGGVAWMDPTKPRHKPAPPPLVVRSLTSGVHRFDLGPDLKLPQGTRNLEIAYAALTYSYPDRIRFRYQLEGSDSTWVDADARRQAFYTNLGPGSYRFLVNVTNENGAWTDSVAELKFVIPPTFLQSRTFLALCIAAAIALLGLAYRLRVGQLEARQQRLLEERLGERERIARELHDTLLQSTQGLILQIQVAADEMSPGDATRVKLDKALKNADSVMAEGRDRVLDLRIRAEVVKDLHQTLAAVGEELASSGTETFRTVVEGTPRELVRPLRDEVLSIAREAMLNAFRHAHAASIEMQFIYADDCLRIRVRDDGSGIDPDALTSGSRPGHWGLPGMRERAQRVGARLDIWSRPGAGTEIELVAPAALAYANRTPRRDWWAFWKPGDKST